MKAKAALETLETMEHEMEEDFVKSLGVTNEDGSIPSRTWMIDNDEIAEKAIEDFGRFRIVGKTQKSKRGFQDCRRSTCPVCAFYHPISERTRNIDKSGKNKHQIPGTSC